MTEIIGAGEDTAYSILGFAFSLPPRKNAEFPEFGIYRQLNIMNLISKKISKEINLSEEFKKHNIDIVISTGKQIIAVYINGNDHNGILKSKRDSLKYDYLQQSNVNVVILRKSECKELFCERKNYLSILEVCNGLSTSKIKT